MARRKNAEPVTIYDREANAPDPAVIVVGMTERGLPQASWFSGTDADVAVMAAGMMGLHAARISSDRHVALARKLRQGQIYASDKAFAPPIMAELYDEVFELCGATPIEAPALQRPTSWDDIAVGSVVLATDADGDWYEAVVMALNDRLVQLRWRSSPRDASEIRARSELALLPPQAAAA